MCKEIKDQLNRIETKLDAIVFYLDQLTDEPLLEPLEDYDNSQEQIRSSI